MDGLVHCESVTGACLMNAVGIDVSKGKSMVTVLRPLALWWRSPLRSGIPQPNLESCQTFLKTSTVRRGSSWSIRGDTTSRSLRCMTRQGRRRRGEAVYPWLGMTAVLSVSFRLTLFAVVCLLHHHPHLNFLCVQAHFGLDFLFAGFSNSTSMHCME